MTDQSLDLAVRRIELWLYLLDDEARRLQKYFGESGDTAGRDFARVLERLLKEYAVAFNRYRQQAKATADERLLWMQQVGAGLAAVETFFGRLDRAISPRQDALIAAFERILSIVLGGRRAVFRPLRFFNYEIEERHAEPFEAVLGDAVDDYPWPFLALNLPAGLLNSPRNHILLGHEIGHAIAAVKRADASRALRDQKRRRRSGGNSDSAVERFLPEPTIPSAEVLAVARTAWEEQRLPPPPEPGAEAKESESGSLIFRGFLANVASNAQRFAQLWIEELFSDCVGACLFGPAYALAFIDLLLPTSELDRASEDHPPLASRLLILEQVLTASEMGNFLDGAPKPLGEILRAAFSRAARMKESVPARESTLGETELFKLVHRCVTPLSQQVIDVAMAGCKAIRYTRQQFDMDVKLHLSDILERGVPPIAAPGEKPRSLATIFNIGQLAAVQTRDCETPTAGILHERWLDGLILKAIELSEFQTVWETAEE